jgi:multimeric flavodoxin WrbA
MKRIIIQGSSRKDGNTSTVIELLRTQLECERIDLKSFQIGHYDYNHENQSDDFLKLMREIVKYDVIIFATPVYWYAMSGLMKVFFDRITDCLKTEKELGRKLRGKHMGVISCSSEKDEVEGFFIPFKNSADYLGMNYLSHVHTWITDEQPSKEVQELISSYKETLDF